MLKITSLEEFLVQGKRVFAVENPIECNDFKWIIGQKVIIDTEEFTVIRVERFAHMPPFRKGERIGLMVDQKDK